MIRENYFIFCVFLGSQKVFTHWMTLIIFLTKLTEFDNETVRIISIIR
jgi:hypothetical protein